MIKFPVQNFDEIIDEYAKAKGKTIAGKARSMLQEMLEMGNDAYQQGWHDGYTTGRATEHH